MALPFYPTSSVPVLGKFSCVNYSDVVRAFVRYSPKNKKAQNLVVDSLYGNPESLQKSDSHNPTIFSLFFNTLIWMAAMACTFLGLVCIAAVFVPEMNWRVRPIALLFAILFFTFAHYVALRVMIPFPVSLFDFTKHFSDPQNCFDYIMRIRFLWFLGAYLMATVTPGISARSIRKTNRRFL